MSEPHVRLKHGWTSSTRLIRARKLVGDSAPLVWVMAVTYCNENQTDGRIHGDALETFTSHKSPAKVIAALVEAEALKDLGDGYFEVRDFLLHNQSKAQRDELLARRKQAGARGGSAKQVLSKSLASAKQTPSKSLASASQLLPSCYSHDQAKAEQAIATATATLSDQEEVQEEDPGAAEHAGSVSAAYSDAKDIRRALVESRSLRATGTMAFAEFLAGYCQSGSALTLADVIRAIGEADEKVTAKEAGGGAMYTAERAASLVAGFVKQAGARARLATATAQQTASADRPKPVLPPNLPKAPPPPPKLSPEDRAQADALFGRFVPGNNGPSNGGGQAA